MKNNKGIFVTNTVSKVFERAYVRLMGKKIDFSVYQFGGRNQ